MRPTQGLVAHLRYRKSIYFDLVLAQLMLSHVSSPYLVATLGVDPIVVALVRTAEPSNVIAAGERKCFEGLCVCALLVRSLLRMFHDRFMFVRLGQYGSKRNG